MDLGAYMQIDNLRDLAEANGIEVERLRGYRLMRDQKVLTDVEITEGIEYANNHAYEQLLKSVPPFAMNPVMFGSDVPDRLAKKYLITNGEGTTIGFHWEKLHGKKRKAAKYVVKRHIKRQQTQMNLWNLYAGREDVLYIHARLGSWNWSSKIWKDYQGEIWFLAGCDDYFDPSYCDIYAKIDPGTILDGPKGDGL